MLTPKNLNSHLNRDSWLVYCLIKLLLMNDSLIKICMFKSDQLSDRLKSTAEKNICSVHFEITKWNPSEVSQNGRTQAFKILDIFRIASPFSRVQILSIVKT